jgi:tRNA A37 threonylcarbamoyladenosine dehydratase
MRRKIARFTTWTRRRAAQTSHSFPRKLAIGKVAIIGLGGTGAYVLDLVAKTPVGQIHLFDKDWFFSHNAFRGPGAPSLEELRAKPLKVEYFKAIYSKMHRGIVAHPVHITGENVELLRGMDFVFLCIDDGMAKRFIIRELEDARLADSRCSWRSTRHRRPIAGSFAARFGPQARRPVSSAKRRW